MSSAHYPRRQTARHRLTRTLMALAFAATVLGAATPPAQGYVRTRTSRGNPIAWRESCVFLVPPLELPANLTENAVLAAIQDAAAHWTEVASSYLRFELEPAAAGKVAEYRPRGGNENVVVFVEQGWEELGWAHDRDAAALTTITYISSSKTSEDGRIIDTDIEVNAERFQFTTTGELDKHDLDNVLTHEVGHVLGLDHTCDDGLVVPIPVDHLGQVIPSCYPIEQVPQEIQETTMFNFASPGETDKRSLAPDDVAGITAVYPLADDPGVCAPPKVDLGGPCNCAGGPGGASQHALPWLLVALWLGWRRRR